MKELQPNKNELRVLREKRKLREAIRLRKAYGEASRIDDNEFAVPTGIIGIDFEVYIVVLPV